MKKRVLFLLALVLALPVFSTKTPVKATETTSEETAVENKDYFTLVYEDGSVDTVYYDQSSYKNTPSDTPTPVDDTPTTSSYGVAYIKGYTTYTEYDGSGTGRTGYVHGQSGYDAAYICTNENGTVRIKQAGVYMDVAASAVEVQAYSESSYTGYYLASSDGYIRHYYYYLSNGTPKLYGIPVGYAPDYLATNVKYFSYDGHYFYTSYESMIDDYRTSVNTYTHAINASRPYYNYYQYLSLRTPTAYSGTDLNNYIQHAVDIYSTVTTSSALYGQGQYIKNNENTYGVNSVILLGIAINESGWGNSTMAKTKNNLFGLNAADNNPNDAYAFSSVESCINYFSYNKVSCTYLNAANSLYRGGFLGDKKSGLNVVYASDAYWGEKAAYYCYMIDSYLQKGDYNAYTIGIDQSGELSFYNDTSLSKCLYNITINYQGNMYLYNYATTIICEENGTYKVISDTVLNDSRTAQNTKGIFDLSRDYLYINKSDVTLINNLTNNSNNGNQGGETNPIEPEEPITPEDPVEPEQPEQPQEPDEPEEKVFPFTDVKETSWAYPYVKGIYEAGIMTGTSETTFNPSGKMNRAMLVVTLYRMAGAPSTAYTKLFTDVKDGKYYSEAITWAGLNGVVYGYNSGAFGPGDLVNRQQVAMMLYNYATYLGMDVSLVDTCLLEDYPDGNNVSNYAKEAMAWAIQNGILTGSQGKLLPKNTATRAECAKMLLVAAELFETASKTGTKYDPVGCVDVIECIESGYINVRGWTYDDDDSTKSINVRVYVDDTYIGTLGTEFERADVNSIRGVTGNHGFSNILEVSQTGSHTVKVYAVDLVSGKEVFIGSKTITIY